jgi:hypothetical protein
VLLLHLTNNNMAIENRGPELLGVNVAFLAAALVSILLRCYVRVFMVKAFGVDDWLMVVAAVSPMPVAEVPR